MLYLKKLKIILLFSFILLVYISYKVQIKYNIPNSNYLEGIIQDFKIDGDKLTLDIKSNKRVIASYYIKTELEKNKLSNSVKIGYIVKLKGKYKEASNNTNFNLFNYKKYLLSKKIYYTFDIEDIINFNKKSSFIYNVKNRVINRINKSSNKAYLKLFIIGENNLDEMVKESYKMNGISHLFAISGMHITLFTSFLLFLLKLVNKNEKINFLIVSILILIYVVLVNFIPSVLRASLFFIILNIKKIFKLKISNFDLIILLLFLLLIYNPFYIYNIGFLYSFIISMSLVYFSELLSSNNYIKSLFKTSLISFLMGIPITINNNFELNLLTLFLNLIFVPFVSIIVFPLSILNFLFLRLDVLNGFVIKILEALSKMFSNLNMFSIIIPKMPLYIFLAYYVLIILIIKKLNIKNILLLILILLIHSNIKYLNNNSIVTMIDVGQGDSILIELPHNKNVLIDTGGKIKYKTPLWKKRKKEYSISNDTIISLLKSYGIKELSALILSHGDADHMAEAINLIKNFKVDKVIFNCGDYNSLEVNLIKELNDRNIEYKSCIKELSIDNNKFSFLQTKEFNNENDNSNVLYTELKGFKFMFMGDASSLTEREILNKYNLSKIDVLKVGHHGSKTSSSVEFINEINPKYSIISVGKNNRYGHPNKEVLENLKDSKIYRTDQDGSIMFKIKNKKLKIETCTP